MTHEPVDRINDAWQVIYYRMHVPRTDVPSAAMRENCTRIVLSV